MPCSEIKIGSRHFDLTTEGIKHLNDLKDLFDIAVAMQACTI